MAKNTPVRRLDLGYFIRPASETDSPQPRVEPVLAYLVQHDRGLILFDTGIGDADPETEAHYRPRRRGRGSGSFRRLGTPKGTSRWSSGRATAP